MFLKRFQSLLVTLESESLFQQPKSFPVDWLLEVRGGQKDTPGMHCQGPITWGRGLRKHQNLLFVYLIRACETRRPGVLLTSRVTLEWPGAERDSDGDVENRIKHQCDCKEQQYWAEKDAFHIWPWSLEINGQGLACLDPLRLFWGGGWLSQLVVLPQVWLSWKRGQAALQECGFFGARRVWKTTPWSGRFCPQLSLEQREWVWAGVCGFSYPEK